MRYALWRCIWSKSTASQQQRVVDRCVLEVKSARWWKGKKKKGGWRTDLLIALENVKPPPNKRLARLGRLVVF